jgi:hypothetical protein
MIGFNEVQARLMGLNNHFRFIGIAELKQLARALEPGEQIIDCLKGWHRGAVSVLCATEKRLIIVDKNTTKDAVREIDYVTIDEFHHIDKGWSSTLRMKNGAKGHEFVSWHIKRLKQIHTTVTRHIAYVKSRAQAESELVDKVAFETNIRPANTSRNWAVFAQRIGNSSLS